MTDSDVRDLALVQTRDLIAEFRRRCPPAVGLIPQLYAKEICDLLYATAKAFFAENRATDAHPKT